MRGRHIKAVFVIFFFFVSLLASGLRAETAQLKDLARAYLGNTTPATEQELRRFASLHAREEAGMLAYFVIGYKALKEGKYAKAEEMLRAARALPTPVSDYVDYFLAMAYQGQGEHSSVVELLSEFERRRPKSALQRRVDYALALSLLKNGQAAESAALVGARRESFERPAADLLLARAYQARGDMQGALRAYRDIYYRFPASNEAKEAARIQPRLPRPDAELLQTRADGLISAALRTSNRARKASLLLSAHQAFQELAAATTATQRERAQVNLAAVLYEQGRTQPAQAALERLRPADPEAAAKRLYLFGECSRRLRRPDELEAQVERLGQSYPSSPWYEEALQSAANAFLLRDDTSKAASYFQTLYERFPAGKYAAKSLWKAAWLRQREGSHEAARKLMEEQVRRFPSGPYASSALYWLGRLVESSDPAAASTYFCRASASYVNHFYGLLAAQRLEKLKKPCTLSPAPAVREDPSPADRTRVLKVAVLKSAWLLDLAAQETQYAAEEGPRRYWQLELARLERERGRYLASIEAARRAVPEHLALEVSQLPREYWELLFPLPWWTEIRSLAAAEGVDPYLVAGVIRQESAFEENAVSRARARGLMQILPSTGQRLARRLRLRRYTTAALFNPESNLQLGIVYLKQLLDLYPGRLEEALAAYNAGVARADAWGRGDSWDPAQFVENISITETREYVQAVLRNVAVYRKLYPPLGAGTSAMR